MVLLFSHFFTLSTSFLGAPPRHSTKRNGIIGPRAETSKAMSLKNLYMCIS